jgi:hypothetical protein
VFVGRAELGLFGALAPTWRVGLAPPIPPRGCKLGSFCTFGGGGALSPGPNWVRFAHFHSPGTRLTCRLGRIGFVLHVFALRRPGLPAARAELGSFRTFHSSGEPAELELWNDGGHREFEVRARRLTLQRTGHGQLLCRHRGPRENHQSSIQRLPPTAFWLSRCLCDKVISL